jgi:hypothetical protein
VLLFYLSLPLMLLAVAAAVGPLLYAMHRHEDWARDAESATDAAMRFRTATASHAAALVHADPTRAADAPRPPRAAPAPVLVGAGERS